MTIDPKSTHTMPFCRVIAFGNPLRGDDGVGPFVAQKLQAAMRGAAGVGIHILPQLDPAILEEVKDADHLIFVDASCAPLEPGLRWSLVIPKMQSEPFTSHHLSPGMFVTLLDLLYDCHPVAWQLAIKGYDFSFTDKLSPSTRCNAEKAIRQIIFWIFTMNIAIGRQKIDQCPHAKERETNG